EPEGVAPVDRDLVAFGQVRRERAVELDGVDVRDAVGQVAREHAEARPDLDHDVVGLQVSEAADHAEDVLVDEEVLAELLLRADAAHRPKAAVAFVSIRCSRSGSPRTSASAARTSITLAGSFGRPRRGCGAR